MISSLLKEERKRLNLTQAEVALLAGVSTMRILDGKILLSYVIIRHLSVIWWIWSLNYSWEIPFLSRVQDMSHIFRAIS